MDTKNRRALTYAFFLLVPFLSLAIICLLTGSDIFNIDMRLSYAGDEMLYSQGVKNTLSFFPHSPGWTTFNEMESVLPSLGAWSPLIFYVYSFFTFLLGGWHGYNTYMLVSVFMFLLASAAFVILLRPRASGLFAFSLYLLLSFNMMRCIWSGTAESLFLSLGMLISAFVIALFDCSEFDKRAKWLCIGIMLCSFLSGVCRPYAFVYSLFPLFFALYHKRRTASLAFVFIDLIGLGFNSFFVKLMSAPYISGGIITVDYYYLAYKQGGFAGLVSSTLFRIFDSFRTIFLYDMRSSTMVALLIVLLVLILVLFFNSLSNKSGKAWVFGASFCAGIAVLFANVLLHSAVTTISRHILALNLILGAIVIFCSHTKLSRIVPIAVVILCSCSLWWYQRDMPEYPIPGSGRYEARLDILEFPSSTDAQKADFLEAREQFSTRLNHTDSSPWANTVDFDASLPYPEYNLLFELPAGFSVSFCWEDYLVPAISCGTLKARYVYTKDGVAAYIAASEAGYSEICRVDEYVILENPAFSVG